MMTNLIRVIDGSITWPYSLKQLRLDESDKSFSWSPSDSELAHYGCYRVENNPPPTVNPATEKTVQTTPVESGGKWVQQWEVVPLTAEEQAAYYDATHPPRWLEFGLAVQQEPKINTLLSTILASVPALAMTLSVGLGKASDGDSRVFLEAWNLALDMGLIDNDLVTLMQTMAKAHDLPDEFIGGLIGGTA